MALNLYKEAEQLVEQADRLARAKKTQEAKNLRIQAVHLLEMAMKERLKKGRR